MIDPLDAYLARLAGRAPAAVRMRQEGELRTGARASRWVSFRATHVAQVATPAFAWDATVRLAPLVRLRVRDRLESGAGAGEVRLFGMRLARDAGTPEMHSGALHRYLAEAVWYPWALQPSAALRWAADGPRCAVATLQDGPTSVSLEFRFDRAGDVESIHTPARWGKFGRHYRQAAWEGHFRAYIERHGVRLPQEAEVGWYDAGALQPVWRGRVLEWTPVEAP